jgi:hypothetical protein
LLKNFGRQIALSPPSTDSSLIKDERWVIKTFRPLLRSLKVQSIPDPPGFTEVYLVDMRALVIQGMSRCIVFIEQQNLPNNAGGMLITSHDMELDYFRLHIIINSSLCNKTDLNDRALQKITVVHEFTHTVAALSAISRVRSKELIKRLKDIFRKKAHALSLTDLEHLADELNNSLAVDIRPPKTANTKYFPDEHFRLGFEDFPVSYPIVFDEFLFSKEMFEEYFSKDNISSICEALRKKNMAKVAEMIVPSLKKISQEKALYEDFVAARIFEILFSDYIKLILNKKS